MYQIVVDLGDTSRNIATFGAKISCQRLAICEIPVETRYYTELFFINKKRLLKYSHIWRDLF